MGSENTANIMDKDIREEPEIKNLLSRMPQKVADSFSDIQLIHLKTAIGSRSWGKHPIDLRGTVTYPFARWHFYYVFLLGRNRRTLSNREQRISAFMTALFILALLVFSVALGLLTLYLAKSFMGIDLFPGFSLGIWDYFKGET
ncbi:MAG: hypothetical protein ACRBBR_08830 [Cellvibrionaceae bacterium]